MCVFACVYIFKDAIDQLTDQIIHPKMNEYRSFGHYLTSWTQRHYIKTNAPDTDSAYIQSIKYTSIYYGNNTHVFKTIGKPYQDIQDWFIEPLGYEHFQYTLIIQIANARKQDYSCELYR